jgi:hypothetical protein
MALANTFIMRVLRQYRREGGKMNILFQTFPAMDLDANLTHMMACEPIAIYHQGGTLDYMMECGQADLVRSRIQKLTFSHHLRSEAAKRRGIPDSTTTATF